MLQYLYHSKADEELSLCRCLAKLMMENQAPASEHAQCGYGGILGYSESSDEEFNPGHPQDTSWEDVSILSRLGLSSCEEMTEEEVENAFARFAMAFHCDQYTLSQRLHAEEHDRAVAQENLQVELQHTRNALQVLYGRLVEDDGKVMVKNIEESLHSLENSINNIITAAENLGATHQEARISHAVELMSLHVDHLKERQVLENTELLEIRRLLQNSRSRIPSDSTEDGESRPFVGDSRQQVTRRRVSVTLIPTQVQMMDLEIKMMEACRSAEKLESQERCVSEPQVDDRSLSDCSPSHSPVDSTSQMIPESTDIQEGERHSDSPLRVGHRRRRHRLRLIEQRSSNEGEEPPWWEESSGVGAGSPEGNDVNQTITLVPANLHRPLVSVLYYCKFLLMSLLVMSVTFLLFIIFLLYIRTKFYWV